MDGADPSPWFLGDLDDPCPVAIAAALPADTVRVHCVGDLPARWPAGLEAAPALVLHRPTLGQADLARIRALRQQPGGGPRILLCVGPHARYRELERWSPLVDAVLPEATASETIARHLPGAEAGPRPPGPRPAIAVVSRIHELRRTLAEICESAGYRARPSADWPPDGEGRLTVCDVPVLEPDWPDDLARGARGRSVVALLGFADRMLVAEARAAGAAACLDLLCGPDDLIFVLDRLAYAIAQPRPSIRGRVDEPARQMPPAPAHARVRTSVRSVADRAEDA